MTKKDERTDRELLDCIRKCAEDKKRIPIANDFVNNPKYPSLWLYKSRFGTFNNAIARAGLQISRYTHIDDEELLGSLMSLYEELGRVPKTRDFINNPKYPGLTTFKRRFGTLNNAIEKLGLDSRKIIYHNQTESCDICGKSFKELIGWYHPNKEIDDGKWTGRWVCTGCLTSRRTNNIDPNCASAKGDMFEELSCRLYNARNLNKDNDNYSMPIDHWCKNFGSFQTRGMYEKIDGWNFTHLERDWHKEYNKMIFYCASKDGKIIERIYHFPSWDLLKRKSIHIRKTNSISINEEYRVKDEDGLNKANVLWAQIRGETNS